MTQLPSNGKMYGAVKLLNDGQYYPVEALADVDGDPTTDLNLADRLAFIGPNGRWFWVDNLPGVLVPLQ